MQNPNPVIKNYIMSSEVFVLDTNSKNINIENPDYAVSCSYFWKLFISYTLSAK